MKRTIYRVILVSGKYIRKGSANARASYKTLQYGVFFFWGEGMWEIKNKKLNLHVYGKTFDEAVDHAIEEYMFLHDEYTTEEDGNMTDDAVELKRTLLQMADKL